jgi:prephenate dehydrogenase
MAVDLKHAGDQLAERLVIVGVGLIGGSLARAVRGACGEIVGCGRNETRLRRALDLGVIDRYQLDLPSAVDGADLVVVAVPLGVMPEVFRAMKGRLAPQAVLTDAGSAKGYVVDAVRQAFGAIPPRFVPGHPIAGNERTGVEASSATLFRGHRVVLTPLPETDRQALARVRALWTSAGAEVCEMEPGAHDEALAATSHLPHMIAYALMDTLIALDPQGEVFRYAAGALRDTTRVAASDPELWRDICLANRAALLRLLQRFKIELDRLEQALAAGDGESLKSAFVAGRVGREALARVLPPSGRPAAEVPQR